MMTATWSSVNIPLSSKENQRKAGLCGADLGLPSLILLGDLLLNFSMLFQDLPVHKMKSSKIPLLKGSHSVFPYKRKLPQVLWSAGMRIQISWNHWKHWFWLGEWNNPIFIFRLVFHQHPLQKTKCCSSAASLGGSGKGAQASDRNRKWCRES